jgi:hypothetical protein
VQKIMGHENLATTQKYVHTDTSEVAALVNKRNRDNAAKVEVIRAAKKEDAKTSRELVSAPYKRLNHWGAECIFGPEGESRGLSRLQNRLKSYPPTDRVPPPALV